MAYANHAMNSYDLGCKCCLCISCNMGKRDLPDMYAQSPRAYISGKSRVHMLQLICNAFMRGQY